MLRGEGVAGGRQMRSVDTAWGQQDQWHPLLHVETVDPKFGKAVFV